MQQFLLNPDGSIPEWADVAALEAAGVLFVVPSSRPTPSSGTELFEGDPVQDADGVWRQVWQERPVALVAPTASEVRSQRDDLLAQTDWMMLPDSGRDTPELRAYRQALREVPQQPGFPFDVVWPTKPKTEWRQDA